MTGTRTATPEPGRAQLVVLLAGSCLAVLGATLIAPVLPAMEDAFRGTAGVHVLVPVVLTVPALVIGLTAPFAGLVLDRVDRKRLLLGALVAYAVLGTAPLYLDSLSTIVASRVLVGLAEAAILTSCTTLIGDYWSGEQRARYLGLQTFVASLGAVVFLGAGGALGALGWRTPFWVYVVALLLVVPMARLLWQPAPTSSATPAPAVRLEPLPWAVLLAPGLVTLVGGVVFYALVVQLPFVLDDNGTTASATIGAVAAVMSVATAAGALLFGRVCRRGPRRLLPVEFAVAGVGLLVVAGGHTLPVIACGAVVTGFGTGLLLPTLLTWFVSGLTFGQRGRGTGLFTGTLFVGQFTSPLILAAVGVGVGGLQAALGVLGVAAFMMAAVSAPASRSHAHALEAVAS